MADPTAVIDAAREVERAGAYYAENFGRFLAAHPELTAISAVAIPGWVAVFGAATIFLAVGPSEAEGAPVSAVEMYRDISRDLEEAIDYLQTHTLTREQSRLQIAGIRDLTHALAVMADILRRRSEPTGTLTISPADIQGAQLDRLSRIVAIQELWRRGHHLRVHGRLRDAESSRASAEVALGESVGQLSRSVGNAILQIMREELPELRRNFEQRLERLADNVRARDEALATRIVQVTRELDRELVTLERWLTHQILPGIALELATETDARKEADHRLRVGLATELETRTDADLELQAALAPLTAWFNGWGLHTTTKVRHLEPTLDRMLGADPGWMNQLLTGGPFVTLVGRLLAPAMTRLPAALGGLEEAATRALGVL